jgi:hypothetical protein
MDVSSDELQKGATTMKTQETTIPKPAKTPRTSSKKSQGRKAKGKTAAKTSTAKRAARTSAAPTKKTTKAQAASKTAIVLELLRREQGATIAEIAKATDWQKHSIRGFISAYVTKKMGLKVESTKSDSGERTYRIVS